MVEGPKCLTRALGVGTRGGGRIRFLPLLSGPLVMSGSISQGRWAASSVTEEDIAKLRKARYLTVEIPHRLPTKGQVIPTPEPNESVVFISHFL